MAGMQRSGSSRPTSCIWLPRIAYSSGRLRRLKSFGCESSRCTVEIAAEGFFVQAELLGGGDAAGGWGVDGVAAGDGVFGKSYGEVALPACRLAGGVVGAEDLRAAGDHGVAGGGVVDAGFFGVGIGAGADEV